MPQIRFVLALHNHQPVGNFDHVFEQAYQESYLPFLDVFERYRSLQDRLAHQRLVDGVARVRITRSIVDRLAELVAGGRIEILGGAFFEPILAMIPRRDRIGQIRSYTRWLEDRLGATVRGMWMPERVWEQSFTRDLVDAGIEYTMSGRLPLQERRPDATSQFAGYYVTEDDGRVMSVFPGSERLRYLIPFASTRGDDRVPGRMLAEQHPGAVVVFGDDGEKFGTWPETHKHVYDDGWLRRFFDALVANRNWLQVTTLAEAVDNVPRWARSTCPTAATAR